MLRGVLICPDPELEAVFEQALLESRMVGLARKMSEYPTAIELVRCLRAAAPDVVFLSFEHRGLAADLTQKIAAQFPAIQVVACAASCQPETLLESMRGGIREFLAPPLERGAVRELLGRVQDVADHRPEPVGGTEAVYAFLPAKAGVGCSTVALNVATALARRNTGRVLLADFDLNSGILGFMLQAQSQHSILDAAENALDMDENLWPKIVTSFGSLDLLPSGKLTPGFRIEAAQIHHLLEFARRHYGAICADLSGMMEKFAVEILNEARRIFVVCTPEIPSLHLAREKISYLRTLDLGERIEVLLNRSARHNLIATADIERLLEARIECAFPNDYAGVHHAVTTGKTVDAASDLGKAFDQLGRRLTEGPRKEAAPRKGLLALLASAAQREAPNAFKPV